jgi:hypothetical protein
MQLTITEHHNTADVNSLTAGIKGLRVAKYWREEYTV